MTAEAHQKFQRPPRWAARQKPGKAAAAPRSAATTAACSPQNGAKHNHNGVSVEAASHGLDELMANALRAAGCADAAAFRKLPKQEQNAFLAQARGEASNPLRGAEQGLEWLDPATIRRSPFNRDDFDEEGLAELTEDVKKRGVVQPGIVRPVKPPVGKIEWEIIAGERRWIAAGRAQVLYPATVRDVDDTEAIELQAIENFQREDLNPMDEARKYAQLRDAYMRDGLSATAAVERIEAKLQRKSSTIYSLLTLTTKLVSQVQVLIQSGRLPKSHGELLTKIRSMPTQIELAAKMLKPDRHDEGDTKGLMSFRDAKRLVEEAEKREKNLAAWQKQAEEFETQGLPVLEGAELVKLGKYATPDYVEDGCGYVTLEMTDRGAHGYKKFRQTLATKLSKLTPVLGRGRDFVPIVLYPVPDVLKALNRQPGSNGSSSSSSSREEREELRKHKLRNDGFVRTVGKVVKEVECSLDSQAFWKWLALALVRQWRSDPIRRLCKRRGINRDTLHSDIARMDFCTLRGLVAEVLLYADVPSMYSSQWGDIIKSACAETKVALPAWGGDK